MITGNTRVLVQNIGYVPVNQVVESTQPVWDGEKIITANVTKLSSHPLLYIELTNGKTITATEEQLFKTMQKRMDGNSWTKAEDLEKTHLVYFTDRTFEFDYLNLDASIFTHLSRLNSYQLGILLGFYHCLKSGQYLDIPKLRKESVAALDALLNLIQANWSKEEYFKRTARFRYTLDGALLEELDRFWIETNLPLTFWTSKPVMKGFLKVLFTFGLVGKEMFTVRAHKESNFLKEIQDYLTLFGINASYSRGLKMSQLTVFKNNCYRFAHNIGVFNPETLLPGVDFKKVLVYKDTTMSDMRYGHIHSVTKVEQDEVYQIDSPAYMANGLILGKYE